MGRGDAESSNTMDAPASCGVAPTNAPDWDVWVVPVFVAIGRFQPAAAAAAAAVPPGATSWESPLRSVSASPGSTACVHAGWVIGTGAPVRSVTEVIGVGGHQTPWLARVAPTLASSRS